MEKEELIELDFKELIIPEGKIDPFIYNPPESYFKPFYQKYNKNDKITQRNNNPNDYIKKIAIDEIFLPITKEVEESITENRYWISNYGRIFSNYKDKILDLTINPDGYYKANLKSDNGNKVFMVHRLVAQAFDPNPNYKNLVIDHINCIKTDNYINYLHIIDKKTNLEWVTLEENAQRAIDNFLIYRLSDDDIIQIFDMIEEGIQDTDIAKYFNINASTLSDIHNGKNQYAERLKQLGLTPINRCQIPDELVMKSYQLSKSGLKDKEVSKITGISKTVTKAIRRGYYKYKKFLEDNNLEPIYFKEFKGQENSFNEEQAIELYNYLYENPHIPLSIVENIFNATEATIRKVMHCSHTYTYLKDKYGLSPIYRVDMEK